MIANEYAYVVQGFRQIATTSNRIQHFIHGDTDRLLNALRTKISYPVLVLDFPTAIAVNQSSEIKQSSIVNVTFAIIDNAAKDDFKRQNDIMLELFEHIKQVVYIMQFGYYDVNNDLQRVFPNAIVSVRDLVPVTGYTSDNLYGWAAEATININSCLPTEWTSNFATPCPPSTLPFTWSTDGSTITCEADNTLTEYTWYYRHTYSNIYETETNQTLTIDHSPDSSTIIVLEYEIDDCVMHQTVSIPASIGLQLNGISYPTLFEEGAQLNEDFWQ